MIAVTCQLLVSVFASYSLVLAIFLDSAGMDSLPRRFERMWMRVNLHVAVETLECRPMVWISGS